MFLDTIGYEVDLKVVESINEIIERISESLSLNIPNQKNLESDTLYYISNNSSTVTFNTTNIHSKYLKYIQDLNKYNQKLKKIEKIERELRYYRNEIKSSVHPRIALNDGWINDLPQIHSMTKKLKYLKMYLHDPILEDDVKEYMDEKLIKIRESKNKLTSDNNDECALWSSF